MSLTKDEMKALRLFISEELRLQLQPFRDEVNQRFDDVNRSFGELALQMVTREAFNSFRDEVNKRFDEVARQIDGLYQRDERREQEYLFIRERIQRLEAKIA